MLAGLIGLAPLALSQTTQPATSSPASSSTASSSPTSRYTPTVTIRRTDTPPRIDGILDDTAWQDAAVIDNLTQVDPVEGAAPTEKTEVRVTYDADHLYVAVYCYDREPDKIVAKQRARDGDVASDDVFTVTFDPYNDERNGYWFEFSPAGAKRDATVENSNTVRIEWDGVWHLKTRITHEGWFAEMAVPFKTISFNESTDTWGFNVGRTIRRKQEINRWAGITRVSAVRNVGNAGRLIGIGGLDQGIGLRVRPFLSGSWDIDTGNVSGKPGIDLFYKITPSITAALTVNTDFAEAEVDTRRVNLTRFPLFFPEKRAFFLQDAGIFSFGGISETPLPFHSRRIGIVAGEEKDLAAGVKLTGRQNALSFGVLNVQMYPDDDLGNKNLSVARATVDVLEQSTLGFIATHGDPSSPGENTVGGLDFNYRRDSADGRIYDGHVWAQAANNDPDDTAPAGDAGTDSAFGANISYPNDKWNLYAGAMQIGLNFRPALGFVQRHGTRKYSVDIRRRFRDVGRLKRFDVATYYDVYTDLNNQLQTASLEVPNVSIENYSGDTLTASLIYNRENFDNDFNIARDIVIPPGDYPFLRGSISGSTSDGRPVALNLKFIGGQFYDGTREDYIASVELRPTASVYATLEGEWNNVHLPQGDFLVRIFRTRLNVLFTPELSWNNSLQYDNISEAGSFNSRIRWEYEPGQELFIVAERGFIVDNGTWNSSETELTMKLGWTLQY